VAENHGVFWGSLFVAEMVDEDFDFPRAAALAKETNKESRNKGKDSHAGDCWGGFAIGKKEFSHGNATEDI
jgi:hypothetical protein